MMQRQFDGDIFFDALGYLGQYGEECSHELDYAG
jgi:hypothetical protein